MIMELEFICCMVYYAIFVFNHVDWDSNYTFYIISWHIDDSLGTSNSSYFLKYMKKKMNGHFGIRDLGPV